MGNNAAAYRGLFLGMAVGDAMGLPVDDKDWPEICENYGPNGLLGYDLLNGTAEVTSYTQVAAYVANGLLLAITRGRQDMYLRYIAESMRQWAKRQHFPRDPEKNLFWVTQIPQLRLRQCRDARMLDALRFDRLGAMDRPINSAASPGAIMTGAVIGMLCDRRRLDPAHAAPLSAQAVALTHGDPEAFLSAAALAQVIAGIIHGQPQSLKDHFLNAAESIDKQFRDKFPQATTLSTRLKLAISMTDNQTFDARYHMEQLGCTSAGECLAGAMYACLVCNDDFDTAMVTAINHSGRSSAVGAITGAILGARLTDAALPEFYLESLEAAPTLQVLANDLAQGNPAAGLFDDDWDHKYVQGLPL